MKIEKKKIFGIILATNDYKGFYNQNKELIQELSIGFKKVHIINLIELKFREKKERINNKKIFPNNYKLHRFSSSIQFLNFFKKNEMVALQYLSKNPDYFKIFFLIKLAKIKNIMIMNLGNFGNKQTPNFNTKNILAFKHYYSKGFYYFFRILTILNVFPKVDLLFESNTEIVKAINNGLSRKFENTFPFLKISYFRKVEIINSIFFDQFKKTKTKKLNNKKFILYVDFPIDHGDRTQREGRVNSYIKKNFYLNLKNFLQNLSNLFNLKVVVGLHPSSKDGFKYLSNFKITKQRTIDLIPKCEIAIFTNSSLVSSAVICKKKIISIDSSCLGNYISDLTNKYKKSLNLYSINIDKKFTLNKSECSNRMYQSINHYEKFISTRLKPDGENSPNKKIVKKIKEFFFSHKSV